MQLIEQIPLWLVFWLTIVLGLLSFEGGFRLHARFAAKGKETNAAAVGTTVHATLGLLSFLLAFTFGIAADRFNARTALLRDDAIAIGTTYLRAEFLPETDRRKVQGLLREYVDLRLRLPGDPESTGRTLADNNRIQEELWSYAVIMGRQNVTSEVTALFIESLNDTIGLHSRRVSLGVYGRVPETIWATLLVIMVLGLAALGYQCGTSGTRSWLTTLVMVVSFAIVVHMIADLDRPTEGFLRTNQKPLIELRERMRTAPAAATDRPPS